jgi:hypothetical protein
VSKDLRNGKPRARQRKMIAQNDYNQIYAVAEKQKKTPNAQRPDHC